ncbi:MAG TPA: manganese efflux pump [Bacteroidales bacterium]|nr:manganese efflux pump [Bacteroidales bacterium]
MELAYIILIALSLGLVAFVNAFWGGIYRCLCFSESLRLAGAFMIYTTVMFGIGTWLGRAFANGLGWSAIPVAESVIVLLGIKLTYYGMQNRPERKSFNLGKINELMAVSFASSLNAFIAGLGYGMLRSSPGLMYYSIMASVVLFSLLGVTLGKKQGRFIIPRIASLLSGISLIILAILLGIELYNLKGIR